MESIITKKCRACGEIKPLDQFTKNSYGKYGRSTICKLCNQGRGKVYYQNHREQVLNRDAKYRREHYEEAIQRQRRYQNENREKVREAVREWGRRNKEKARQIAKRWVANNRERNRENQRRWANENKDKRMLVVEKRRAQKQATGGTITKKQWQEILVKYGYMCLCCKKTDVDLTMDHVIPLSKGGTHTVDNIQPLCGICNSAKHTKIIDYRPF